MSVFLNILRLFMPKQIVCLCVFHLLIRVCLEPQLQVWVQAAGARGAPCTCCTEVGAESPGWEVTMYNESFGHSY